MIANVNVSILWAVLHNLEANDCQYVLGAKAPRLDCDTSAINAIDCSGFTRYALAKATGQQLIIPDGSANQHEWCDRHGLHAVDYANIGPFGEGRLFIAFIAPSTTVGHVWLINGTDTLESHGHKGPDSRPWDTPILRHNVCAAYELPIEAE